MRSDCEAGPAEACGTLRRMIVHMLLSEIQTVNSYRRAKEQYDDPSTPGGSYEVEEILNISYLNRREAPLAMDIYKPAVNDAAELPVIVTLYGGGLIGGDRKSSRRYARELASHGYLVFAIEYRLVPMVDVTQELDDVCAGLDLVGRKLVDFNVDFSRIFLTGSSAGAYLAIYVSAMKDSVKLQKAIGYEPSRVRFKAIGVDCGMFYTSRGDLIGLLLAEQFYGEKRNDPDFLRYCDPEHPEIINHLPPVFLTTSRGDFLNRYTLDFHRALKKAGKATKLVYYGEIDLQHAFLECHPEREQSQDAICRMLHWFEEQADIARGGSSKP